MIPSQDDYRGNARKPEPFVAAKGPSTPARFSVGALTLPVSCQGFVLRQERFEVHREYSTAASRNERIAAPVRRITSGTATVQVPFIAAGMYAAQLAARGDPAARTANRSGAYI